jgi:acetolactate synthase-1/2/3 large subunit
VGVAAHRKRTSQILSRFIDETGIPLFSTQMGKGVVDERHPLFLGNAALSATTTSTARLSGQTWSST